ncbi:MAG: hypothetical protein A2622_12740 [Bdellovibrionales bacterium RIFCSPHIGHO2_01_FULL_40_29]|nr:MAG: hypothetical protein A2622_12740 [Bdellovibrionales bacterium RIFCSPHIGHO2_01_FULL_40_29]OFZ33438.1 MAG: hypothetical protein A3D17_14145 [Bdellovibrionales bacterium RIFCSPHIGHO2_02_FULL_40_15]
MENTMKSLFNFDEVSALIRSGKVLVLAGDEALLKKLPHGQWIGGTIPYFMSERGGLLTHDEIQVTQFPDIISDINIRFYSENDLEKIPQNYSSNGVNFCLIPAQTGVHRKYAEECSTWTGIFDRPLLGWITGVDLKDLGKITPKVINGKTGEVQDNQALVMHMQLPENKYGKINIINLFKQGSGDTITFPDAGFLVQDCFINGVKRNFSEYLKEKAINTQLPLVADYMGTMVNVSFQAVDEAKKTVALYAPVFPMIEYKVASPIGNYEKEFEAELVKHKISPVFSCNCILNYLYAGLEGKKTGNIVGPITFGEIAYMLLNQTMVYLTFENK